MDQKQTVTVIAMILSTLADTGGECAESTLYLAIGGDIHKWHGIKSILVGSGFITCSPSSRVTLTAKGREIGEKVSAALATAK